MFGNFSKFGKGKMAHEKSWDSPDLPTLAKQIIKYSPKSTHLPNPLFEKNDISLVKFA
jgi:hypothetical protein